MICIYIYIYVYVYIYIYIKKYSFIYLFNNHNVRSSPGRSGAPGGATRTPLAQNGKQLASWRSRSPGQEEASLPTSLGIHQRGVQSEGGAVDGGSII